MGEAENQTNTENQTNKNEKGSIFGDLFNKAKKDKTTEKKNIEETAENESEAENKGEAQKENQGQREMTVEEFVKAFKALEAENAKLKEETDKLKEEVARSRADYFNLRTRTERDRERNAKLACEDAIKTLMPVFENLGRIMEAAEKESPIAKGVDMVIKQFADSMCRLGLEFISTEGDFDPSLHEAIGMEEVDKPELDGKITTVVSIGYKIAGRVIKAPQVRVGQYNG